MLVPSSFCCKAFLEMSTCLKAGVVYSLIAVDIVYECNDIKLSVEHCIHLSKCIRALNQFDMVWVLDFHMWLLR